MNKEYTMSADNLLQNLVAALSEKDETWNKADPDIGYGGKAIVLPNEPKPMSIRSAISVLEQKLKDEETEMNAFEIIDAYPDDALVALHMAMKEIYGWASAVPTMSFFGPIPPTLRTIKTGPNPGDQVQVAEGEFKLPNVENNIRVDRYRFKDQWVLLIRGTVRKRENAIIKELANRARELLKTNSIYRAKAINLKVDGNGNLTMDEPPVFLQTANIRETDLILNKDELDQVSTALWAPIRNTEACERAGIPLNRGILLEGPFGTGKSMTAHVTSKVAVDNGWTYILLDDVRALKDALLFAQRYAPAVVFAEDIDRVIEERDQAGNDLLNTIDGILTKDAKVITVLTTNFVEKLDRAMLRPGRLDAVITVMPPDAESVERLIRLYSREMLDDNVTLKVVADYLKGQIPATIREVVERSKLAAIAGGRQKVIEDDLLISAKGMKRHLTLLNRVIEEPTKFEKLGMAFTDVIAGGTRRGILGEDGEGAIDTSALEELADVVESLSDQAAALRDDVQTNTMVLQDGAKKTVKATKAVEEKVDAAAADVKAVRKAVRA